MTDQQAVRYRGILTTFAALVAIWGILGLIDRPNVPFSGLHYQNGNLISFISEDSPAEEAGVLVGDRVLSVNGVAVHGRRDVDLMPRPQVGETQTFVIDRDGEQISLELTQAGLPMMPMLFSIIGISFLAAGLWAYLKVPTPRTLVLCLAGIGLGATISPGPYFSSYGLRLVASSIDVSFPLIGFAFFLLFLLMFPSPKALVSKKTAILLILGPPILIALTDLVLALFGTEATAGLESLLRLLGGVLVLVYLLLGLVAAGHSYFTASKIQRSEWGLNMMLGGLVLGIVPILLVDLVVLSLGIEFGGAQFAFVMLAMVPISLALAAVKKEKSQP